MFPDILGNLHRAITGPVEVDDGGVFSNTGGVQEVPDGILRWLPTHNYLIGI